MEAAPEPSSTDFDLQVIVPSGPESAERAVLGFAMALSAAASGDEVVVFLTMHGAAWAAPEHPTVRAVPGFQDPAYYLELLAQSGVRLEACTSCVENFCDSPRGPDGQRMIRDGMVHAGLSTAAIRATKTQTVVF